MVMFLLLGLSLFPAQPQTLTHHTHSTRTTEATATTTTSIDLFPGVFDYWWKRFRYQTEDSTEDTINQLGKLQVVDRPGFFGYDSSSASKSTIKVSYNARSMLVNGQPLLLLGGSIHPVRHSRVTWEAALDEAVAIGFNLVTVYVMWSAHQPTVNVETCDWRLPGSDLVCSSSSSSSSSSLDGKDSDDCWTLSTALQMAADRRLWVHLRIGPYVCAEYNYGGIPEFVPLQSESMSMRRPNGPWLTAMQQFVQNVTTYVASNKLWAYQGGNILMAQIENELQGNIDLEEEYIMWITDNGNFVDYPTERRANLQDYANWCGQIAQQTEPNVVWTMCNGLMAPNTLETFNGVDSSAWLAQNGTSGRVQVDFPAIFTEFEGGFQIWGDDPEDPSDYFWGRTGRDYSAHAMRWFARGGTHLNYYMFAGGYNRGRMAAAGIMNMYASDAPLCSSGLRRQPKFDHLQKLHLLIQDNAKLLLSNPQRAWPEHVEIQGYNGTWVIAPTSTVSLFRYVDDADELLFVENMQNQSVKARWRISTEALLDVDLNPWSVSLFKNSHLIMDSTQIDPKAKMYRRYVRQISLPPPIQNEVYSIPSVCGPGAEEGPWPIEQTELMVKSQTSSDFAWYATEWNQTTKLSQPKLVIETQLSNAFVVFLDGHRMTENNTHPHLEGKTTLTFPFGASLSKGPHRLVVLSESLGYDNVIGVWGASTAPKLKGITGNVYLASPHGNHQNLTPATQKWCSCAGLLNCGSLGTPNLDEDVAVYRTVWRFATPQLNQGERLFVRVRSGRGHFFLNGMDMGRYWNITRQHSGQYSQANYFLPADYLRKDENELVMENVLGEQQQDVLLLATHVVPGSPIDFRDMEDIVGFPRACF
jgi:hypothetical protein